MTARPNIVLFMMDTQGARNLSCYGYRKPTTPNIDAIAADGALFENHFVPAPWTLPVHASLFTGTYQCCHGAGAQHEDLEPGLPQMGEIFTRNGYRTVSLCNNGWAYAGDLPGSAGQGFQEHIRYGSGSVRAVAPYVPSDDPSERDNGSLKAVGVGTAWIDRHVAASDAPFLMFINCTEPHDPYLPPEPWRSRFLEDGVSFEEAVSRKGGQAVSTIGDRCLTFEDWAIQRSLYDGETACLDDRIGKLVSELKQRGLYDNTVFIVTGDHGDVLGERTHYAYHSQNGVWDGTCKTPLVIRFPGVFEKGNRCPELVQITDILPTLLGMCDIDDELAAEWVQGADLRDALRGPVREFALLESQRAIHVMRRGWTEAEDPATLDVRFANVAYKAARGKDMKYIWASNGQDMLFDVGRDPDERWNVIDRYPKTARDMQRSLERVLMSLKQRFFPDRFREANAARQSPEVIRRLQAWGLYEHGVAEVWDPAVQTEWAERNRGR